MSPWLIVVTCLEAAQCQSPDLGANNYPTRVACDHALVQIVHKWKPTNGNPHAYSFRCRRWPW